VRGAGVVEDPYLRLVGRGARLHAGPDLPADLAWVEWPSWDGGAVHALARRTRGRWRTTLLRAARGQGCDDVLRRLRSRSSAPGSPVLIDRPDEERARIVLGAFCGDLSGILALALRGSGTAPSGRLLREAEAHHAGEIAPFVELMLGSDALDAFGDCAAGRILTDAVGLLTADDGVGETLRALRRSHPLVARLALSSTLVTRALCAGVPFHEALAVPCPGYVPAHLRRAAGATLAPIAATVPAGEDILPEEEEVLGRARAAARLAAALPPDWMPRGPGGWTALATLASALGASPCLGPETLRRSKGDWEPLVARLARGVGAAGQGPRRVAAAVTAEAGRLGEARQALLRQVVLPLAANARHRLAFPRHESGDEIDLAADGGLRAVDALLWADKDVGACLDLARSWRARRETIDRAVADVESEAGSETSWPALAPPFGHRDVEVRVISDALALWEEGAATADRDGLLGLDHCIYGRLRLFRAGHAHGLSLRRAGGGARLSTAQVAIEAGRPVLVEHRGRRNAEPDPEAGAALSAFLDRLAAGPAGALPEPPPRPEPPDGLWDLCGYDWRRAEAVTIALEAWAPLLPRWFRGLDAAAAHEALVARGLLDPAA